MGERKNSKVILGVIVALVIVLLGVCIAFIAYVMKTQNAEPGDSNVTEEEAKQREYVVTKDNVEEIKQELQEDLEDAYYNVTMNTKWSCSADTYELKDAYIANSTANNRTVYFNLILPDTEEIVYSSPFIPVGQELRGFTLEKELPVGKNVVWVEYHLVDDDEKELTTVTVTATITVQ